METEASQFFLRTDMSEKELSRIIECVKDFAKKAVAQHKQGVAEAVTCIENILEELGSALREETGHAWIPALTQVDIPGNLVSHSVFAVQVNGENAEFHISVETKQVLKEVRPGEIFVGYETTGKASFPDEDETEISYSDVITPLRFGEVI